MNMPSDFPRHLVGLRRGAVMVVLITIVSVVVCGWIAVRLLSDVGAAWLGAVAGLPVAMLSASIGTAILPVASTACSLRRPHPARVADSPLSATPVETFLAASRAVVTQDRAGVRQGSFRVAVRGLQHRGPEVLATKWSVVAAAT